MEPTLSAPIGAFILFAFTMSATPGPNNAMVAASGANFGFRRSIPHAAGIATGFALMILLVALGAGAILRAAPSIHDALRWVGALYLLWLAVKIARSDPAAVDPAKQGRPMTMLQAALFQWINPKAWIVTMGAVATYTSTGDNVLGEAALLAVVFFIVSWPASAIWIGLGAGAARMLGSPARLRAFNWLMAGLLVLSLLPTLAE
jgi:threonine/homoserine/homoserine lactone efflux protein